MPVTPLRTADPAQVGPYRLLGRLGQGGMGTVFLGVARDERAVAVKVLRDGIDDPEARRRFRHELEALRRVSGPSVVEVLDADVDADPPWLVTRFVPGQRLDELVAAQGPLEPAALQVLARGLADALAVLHGAGVVHRDLTPANVLLVDGQPQVIDLGLALAADVTVLTRSGTVVGTPGYLAPEQVRGEAATPAADVHAWGATIAFAATGRPPYGTGRPEAVLYRIVHGGPDLTGVPAPLAPLVAEAMRPDPATRPSAAQLVERLGPLDAPTVVLRLPVDADATTVLRTLGDDAALAQPRPSWDRDRTLTLPERSQPERELAGVSSGPRPVVARAPGSTPAATPLPPRRVPLRGSAPAAPPTEPSQRRGPDVDPTAPYADDAWARPPRAGGGWDAPPARPGTWDTPAAAPPAPAQTSLESHGAEPVEPDGVDAPLPAARRAQLAAVAVAGLALVATTTLVVPVLVAATVLVLLVLLQSVARSSDSLRGRRERRGGRRGDLLLAVLGAPWHLVRATVTTVVGLPLVLVVAAVPAGAVYLADPVVDGLAAPELAASVATVVAVLVALRRRAHAGSRRLLRDALLTLSPGATGAVAGVLAVLALVALAVAEGSAPVWSPLSPVTPR